MSTTARATAVEGTRFAPQTAVRDVGLRLRLAAYVLLLALAPVLLAYAAIGRFAEQSEAEQADAELRAVVRVAGAEVGETLEGAEATATSIARLPRVQRALARRDADGLVRLSRTHEQATFRAGPLVVGGDERPAARRAVDVKVDGRKVGSVAVAVPFDAAFLERLADKADVPRGDLLVVAAGDRIVAPPQAEERIEVPPGGADDVVLGASSYRGVAADLPDTDAGTKLVALRPHARIEAAAAGERERVGLAALAMLAAVTLLAYALAPALARGRVALQQRALAPRVLSNLGDGVFLVDAGGTITFWNPGAAAITGLSATAVVGRRLEEAIPAWRAVAARIPVGGADQSERQRAETVLLEIGGRERWLSLAGVSFPEGTVYTFRDVTAERRLEEAKADFVTTASHELRTPLASIYGAAMTLQRRSEELDPPLRERLLETIGEQSERLARIVDEILVTNQLSAGTLHVASEPFDAVEVARAAVDAARLRLPPGLSIELVTGGGLTKAAGDPGRAQQVLANLVDNAVKYSPDGGRIEVRVQRAGPFVRFVVRDEGLGIPAGERERIFEKFYRLDPDLTRGAGGTGLGLYIARELVRRMGGRIGVESQPGEGSTFFVELPVAERESGQ